MFSVDDPLFSKRLHVIWKVSHCDGTLQAQSTADVASILQSNQQDSVAQKLYAVLQTCIKSL